MVDDKDTKTRDMFEDEFDKEYNEILRKSAVVLSTKSEDDEHSRTERPLGLPGTDG
jgi:hypothetical protein